MDIAYRLRHGKKAMYEGLIRHDPVEKDEIVVAAFSCSSNKDRGDRVSYVRNIDYLDPTWYFLAGDQSYDHTEHTASWLLFGSQFGEIWRTRPCISIPDDHDIGQGNLWGESGKVSHTAGIRRWRLYLPSRIREDGGALPDRQPSRPLRSHTHRAGHRGLLYKPGGGRSGFCHHRGPQVQIGTQRKDPTAGPPARSHL